MTVCKECGKKFSELLGAPTVEQKNVVHSLHMRGITIPDELCDTCTELHIASAREREEGYGHNGPFLPPDCGNANGDGSQA